MILALLQARLSSRRLPGKALLDLCGKPLLEWQIARVRRAKTIDQLVVVTSKDQSDDALVEFCAKIGVDCYRGSLEDVLARFAGAAEKHRPEWVVRLTGDCPLTDPAVIDQVVKAAISSKADYVSNTLPATFPDGLDVEVIRYSALLAAHKEAKLPSEREHVTLFVKNHPERFRLKNVTRSPDLSHWRLTVDHAEDFFLIEEIHRRLLTKKGEGFAFSDVEALLRAHPELLEKNSTRARNEGLFRSKAAEPLQPLKLALGTAQFGLDYGITNSRGRLGEGDIRALLAEAAQSGCNVLDTAPDYGEAETALGKLAGEEFSLVTKTYFVNKPAISAQDASKVRDEFMRSLEKMRREHVNALMVHYAADLKAAGGARIWEMLLRLQEEGLAGKIGCSVYDAEELDAVAALFPIQIVQLPLNAFDQRLERSGHLARLHARGVEIHARSAFLQGVLLADPASLPTHFSPWKEKLAAYQKALAEQSFTPLSGALAYIASTRMVDRLVVGVTNPAEWSAILAANTKLASVAAFDFAPWAEADTTLLNPSLWPKR